MRRLRLQHILAWLVFGTGIAWSIYDWFVVDEGIRYFAEDYRRTLLLLFIVAVGTPILLGHEALSSERKRCVSLWLVGTLAAGTTIFTVHIAYGMLRLTGFLLETGQLWMGLLSTLFPCVLAAGLWWAFCRIRQTKPVCSKSQRITKNE